MAVYGEKNHAFVPSLGGCRPQKMCRVGLVCSKPAEKYRSKLLN